MNEANSYFDEAYFERGWERGTAYDNYSRGALTSPTYRELAEAIAFVFKPERCLEIGCATGPIVKHLNDLGAEAHGIDVSAWAIDNKLHPNVVLAGADVLPYPDKHFDLVFSSHSLEHIPEPLIDAALREMDRVATDEAVQFHLHPIVGTYPYDYDEAVVIANLKKDPTHNILQPMEWWAAAWMAHGWRKLDALVLFAHDTDNAELSSGQMMLCKSADQPLVTQRTFRWNQLVHRNLLTSSNAKRRRRFRPTAAQGELSPDTATVLPSLEWDDIGATFDAPISMQGGHIILLAEVFGEIPPREVRALRVALIEDKGSERGVLERWVELSRGVSTVELDVDDFTAIEGTPDLGNLTSICFGGELRGAGLKATVTLYSSDGSVVRLI
jgi:SAM-dependent methyltransferase